MITDVVFTILETRLAEKFKESNIVPIDKAFPTTGAKFIRLVGANTLTRPTDQTMEFIVQFTVECSIRTRTWPQRAKRTPYLTLTDLQEQVYFYILQSQDIRTDLVDVSAIAERKSVVGRFKSDSINTKPQTVRGAYYGSKDESSDREAGLLLSQVYRSPVIKVPWECLTFPTPLDTITGTV